jgi:hypothetical protein
VSITFPTSSTARSPPARWWYRLAWATAECVIDPFVIDRKETFSLPVSALRALVQGFPKPGTGRNRKDRDVRITLGTGGEVRFDVEGEEFSQSTTMTRRNHQFPKWERVVKYGAAAEPGVFGVSPAFAADMFTALRKVVRYRTAVAVSGSGSNTPVRFSIPSDGPVLASGLLMPIKEA